MQAWFADTAHLWMGEITPTLTRYIIFTVAVWFGLWVVLAGVLRARKIREASPPGRQLIGELFFSLRSMAIFATTGVVVTLAQRSGFYPLAEMGSHWGPIWFWIALPIGIVAHDAYFYWVHRLMHRPSWFRRTHRRHHKSNNPSPFTAYSFDINEALLMVGFAILWPLVFPTPWGAMQWIMLHQIVRNTLLHSGYELMPARRDGRPWLDFMTTTTHHDLHHGQAGYNYAAWFTWWDRWMGTEHPEYAARYAAAVRRKATLPARIEAEPQQA
jgi:sterol desaturase/sphingolipid hydroxylase (fatty acid hydroxylase superfamily)